MAENPSIFCLLFQVIVAAVAPFEKAVDNYPDGASEGYVDLIQSFFECCGKKNSLDYPLTGIPESCALLNYAKGCSKAVPEKLGSNVILVAGVALGSGAVMVREIFDFYKLINHHILLSVHISSYFALHTTIL